jgi:hypothetical protein
MDLEIRSVEFDVCRDWISKARDAGYSWDQIFLCRKNSVDELEGYLENQKTENFWPISLDAKAWREIVAIEQSNESKKIELEDYYDSMMLTDLMFKVHLRFPKTRDHLGNYTKSIFKKMILMTNRL